MDDKIYFHVNKQLNLVSYLECSVGRCVAKISGSGTNKIPPPAMAKDEEDDLLPDKDAAKGFYAKYEPKEILGRSNVGRSEINGI
ncbi:unnamed protein product [Hermetia illucens]|uniref:Uncharacterized protein n=1 Tax=Hermetia illucens TaxID=343691 RepID=A0A7R8UUF4_HERIL|nr:unnamed protein product [Hermetia illucens]